MNHNLHVLFQHSLWLCWNSVPLRWYLEMGVYFAYNDYFCGLELSKVDWVLFLISSIIQNRKIILILFNMRSWDSKHKDRGV